MTYYCDKNTAPLRFYKFSLAMQVVAIVINCCILIPALPGALRLAAQGMPWLLLLLVFPLVWDPAVCIGLFCWKKYAWVCVILEYAFQILAPILSGLFFDDTDWLLNLADIVGNFVICSPALYYYFRRKPLFYPEMCKTLTPQQISVKHVRCPKCGTRTDKDGLCHDCGTQAEPVLPQTEQPAGTAAG